MKNLNINGAFQLHKKFFLVEEGSLYYKKKSSLLKGSLGNENVSIELLEPLFLRVQGNMEIVYSKDLA